MALLAAEQNAWTFLSASDQLWVQLVALFGHDVMMEKSSHDPTTPTSNRHCLSDDDPPVTA